MIDRDKTLAGLTTMKVYFENKAEAETRAADRKRLMLHWAEICRDAAKLIELQAERIAIMEVGRDDEKCG